ncbi:hypothetical protein [Methylibium sp.]|uniref:hypothetical protein n=1 Tax=Methylibium sp. TaxID=2067992 RepID=UPI0017C1C6EF|nr:hypothetical protein [Methylibium sp.]MBA3588512.1 hypothetical protein [Methylibium sp.]
MGNVTPQQVGAANVVTTAFTLGGGSWARRWGRQQPMKGTSTTRILAEVRENLHAQDINGLAYGPETLWVRCLAASSTGSLNQDELDQDNWMGVPATLPAGYTARNTRNIGPACQWGGGADGWLTANPNPPGYSSPFFPSAGSPANFVRSAGGIHYPLANDGVNPWGPWNRNNLHVRYNTSLSEPPPNADIDRPVQISWGAGSTTFAAGATSRTAPESLGNLLVPGYRSVGMYLRVNDNWYTPNPAATYPQFQSMTATLTLGSASRVVTFTRGELTSFGGAPATYVVNKGNVGDLIPSLGDTPILSLSCAFTFSSAPIALHLSGLGGLYLYLVPRVDIPLPFTATGPGNLVAPGGIITGSIPGF